MKRAAVFCALGLVLPVLGGTASAYDYQLLHVFQGPSIEGSCPTGSLVHSGSLLYGTTAYGIGVNPGTPGVGTIYSLDPETRTVALVYEFPQSSYAFPSSLLASDKGLYGLAHNMLFLYSTSSGELSTLHTFSPGLDGQPNGSLVQSGTVLYGVTSGGGSALKGSLFGFDTTTNAFTTVRSFTGGPSDGMEPAGSLVLSGNSLYGMTAQGGLYNEGTLFAYDLTSHSYNLLYSFTGEADGARPRGSLLVRGDTLYGTAGSAGSANKGTIFAYSITAKTCTTLHAFSGGASDGASPLSVIEANGVLYGTTVFGGAQPGDNGTVFAFDLAANEITLLHSFTPDVVDVYDSIGLAPGDYTHPDGARPSGDLLLVGDTLYGMTSRDSILGFGTLFSITIPEPSSLAWASAAILLLLPCRRRRVG